MNEAKQSEIRLTYTPIVNQFLCNGCGNCARSCPVDKAPRDPEKTILKVINGMVHVLRPELCEGCGLCVENCPQKAIIIKLNI